MASSSMGAHGHTAPVTASSSTQSNNQTATDRRRPPPNRTALSCTKCRERKVKCSRNKPCDACCARGIPKECEFTMGDGTSTDFAHIQQSYQLRDLRTKEQRLRQENIRLREEIQQLRENRSAPPGEEVDSDEDHTNASPQSSRRAAGARQRRFRTNERTDNIYFGTPGLANVVAEFANLNIGNQSLTHTLPHLAQQVYTINPPMYPFPAMWFDDNTPSALVRLLPPQDKIQQLLEALEKRAGLCSFPHSPEETTRQELERFLADVEDNAQRHPDMLALIFVTLATAMQVGQFDRSGRKWVAGAVEDGRRSSDVFLACSMQALRLASFMSQPTMLCLQTLVMMGPYLTNSGRFLDAWTLFGTTYRMAHAVGLHRNPKALNPVPSLRESLLRQTLWWWMLHLDQQYSVTLGRPLGISGLGDCPPPRPLTTNPTVLRLDDFTNHLTLLSRQILSSDGLMSIIKIDEFTDKLVGLWDTMPEPLQFKENWQEEVTELPEWPLEAQAAKLFAKVQCLLILINRQRIERTQNPTTGASPATSSQNETLDRRNRYPVPLRGRPLVLKSSVNLIQTFLFFYHRDPAILICWTLGQQAFTACMILILDAWETENEQNEQLLSQAYSVFTELHEKGVHQLAALAVQRISDGLAQIGNRRASRQWQSSEQSRRSSAASTGAQQQYRQQQHAQQKSHGIQEQYQGPLLTLDAALSGDLSGDSVMANTGMFLLEDNGIQSYMPSPFSPMNWSMPASSTGTPSYASQSSTSHPSPHIRTPSLPVTSSSTTPFGSINAPAFTSPCGPLSSPYTPTQPVNYQRRTTFNNPESVPYLSHMPPPEQNTVFHAPANVSSSFPASSRASPAGRVEFLSNNQRPQNQPRRQSYPEARGVRQPAQRGNANGPESGHQQAYDGHRLDQPPQEATPRPAKRRQ